MRSKGLTERCMLGLEATQSHLDKLKGFLTYSPLKHMQFGWV